MKRVFFIGRISTSKQNEDRQNDRAEELNIPVENRIIITMNGDYSANYFISELKKRARPNDDIHFIDLSRIGRDKDEIQAFVKYCFDNKLNLISDQESWLKTNEDNNLISNLIIEIMLSITSTFAQMDKERIKENQKQGINSYRAKNQKWGRPCADKNLIETSQALFDIGKSFKEINRATGIKKSTFYKYVAGQS